MLTVRYLSYAVKHLAKGKVQIMTTFFSTTCSVHGANEVNSKCNLPFIIHSNMQRKISHR